MWRLGLRFRLGGSGFRGAWPQKQSESWPESHEKNAKTQFYSTYFGVLVFCKGTLGLEYWAVK